MKILTLFFLLTSAPLGWATSTGNAKNVHGLKLQKCGEFPKTGFYRDGYCFTGAEDEGTHVACAILTKEFLEFTKKRGNDLMSPDPKLHFPGLKAGDHWCLCVLRWKEAYRAAGAREGAASPVGGVSGSAGLLEQGLPDSLPDRRPLL
jgi:uncharacterized protein (DUF2237 family)